MTAGYASSKRIQCTVYSYVIIRTNAVVHALKSDRAMLLSPTASGKSFIIYLLTRFHVDAERRKVLIVVPTTSLVEQMASDFIEYNNGECLDQYTRFVAV